MPIGVASMSFTCPIPTACTSLTWAGRAAPLVLAASAGTRLSKINVVLPDPDTPVTTVRRPFGISTSSGLTVWIAPVERWMCPCSNSCSAGVRGRTIVSALPERYGPIWESGWQQRSSTVPWTITCPPPAPASGPISTIQSASERIWVSWSTSNTELPSATRSCITAVRPSILEGCRPMEGSSSTYSTPVVRLRTDRASCIRWRSPVERVEAARSRVRYPSPSSISRRAAVRKESQMLSAMGRISSGREPGTPSTQSARSDRVILQASSRPMPRSLGARASSESRVPPQSGQMSSRRNFSTRFMPFSSLTLERAFSTVYTALK